MRLPPSSKVRWGTWALVLLCLWALAVVLAALPLDWWQARWAYMVIS